jgi:hypothetical protein
MDRSVVKLRTEQSRAEQSRGWCQSSIAEVSVTAVRDLVMLYNRVGVTLHRHTKMGST